MSHKSITTISILFFLACLLLPGQAEAGKTRLLACDNVNRNTSAEFSMLTGSVATYAQNYNCASLNSEPTDGENQISDYWAAVVQEGNISTTGNGGSWVWDLGPSGLSEIKFGTAAGNYGDGIWTALGTNSGTTTTCFWVKYTATYFGGENHAEYSCINRNNVKTNSPGFTSPTNGIEGLGSSESLFTGTLTSGSGLLGINQANLQKVISPNNGEIVQKVAIGLRCPAGTCNIVDYQRVLFRKASIQYAVDNTKPDLATWDKHPSDTSSFSQAVRPWEAWSGDAADINTIGYQVNKCGASPGTSCSSNPAIYLQAADRVSGATWIGAKINGQDSYFTDTELTGDTTTLGYGSQAVPDACNVSYATTLGEMPCSNGWNGTGYNNPYQALLPVPYTAFASNGLSDVAVCAHDYDWTGGYFLYDSGLGRYCGDTKQVLFDNAVPTASWLSAAGQNVGGERVWRSSSLSLETSASDSGAGLASTSVTRATCDASGNPGSYSSTEDNPGSELDNDYLDNNRGESKTDSATFDLSSVPDGTSYAYRLTAKDYPGKRIGSSVSPGWQYQTTADSGCFSVDNTPPVAGSITAPEYDTDGILNLSFTSGSDATSGIDSSLIQRQAGDLFDDNCYAYGVLSENLGPSPVQETSLQDGCYVYTLTLIDKAGNASTSSRTVKVDTIAPDAPNILLAPSGSIKTSSTDFSFSGETGATFKCSIDNALLAAASLCSSGQSYAGLSEGEHTFRVWQTDRAGNVSDSNSKTFQVDFTSPTASWSVPSSPTKAKNIRYTLDFSESISGLSVRDFSNAGTAAGCLFSLDKSSGTSIQVNMSGCSEGTTRPVLLAGKVQDGAGNPGPPFAVEAEGVLVDRTPPAAPAITSLPSSLIKGGDVSISFTGTQETTFKCSLNQIKVSSASECSSPKAYTGLQTGSYLFRVFQTDKAGNVSPASKQLFAVRNGECLEPKIKVLRSTLKKLIVWGGSPGCSITMRASYGPLLGPTLKIVSLENKKYTLSYGKKILSQLRKNINKRPSIQITSETEDKKVLAVSTFVVRG